MGTKGNNGKGRKRQLIQRLTAVASCLLLFCVVLLVGVGLQEGDTTQRQESSHSDYRARQLLHKLKKSSSRSHRHQKQQDTQKILSAEYHLVDLHVSNHEEFYDDYSKLQIQASFCQLSWELHKEDPSTYPMFRDLLAASPDCQPENRVRVDFREILQSIRDYDKSHTTNILDLTAVVFHESRCGSTLTANLLASFDTHRVYSESSPLITALLHVCGDTGDWCTTEVAAQLVRDVVYLMSRSNNNAEKRVFFKIQSVGSRKIELFQTAFPETPHLFVYREPVQVLQSQLKHGVHSANCLRQKRHPPPAVQTILEEHGQPRTPQDYCAAHLASLTEAIVGAANEYTIPINYRRMPDILYEAVFPKWLGELSAVELERMRTVASFYSKGRGERSGTVFEEDSVRKDATASEDVKAAATRYLQESYDQLEELAARSSVLATT